LNYVQTLSICVQTSFWLMMPCLLPFIKKFWIIFYLLSLRLLYQVVLYLLRYRIPFKYQRF
jgi:hypothetical protein